MQAASNARLQVRRRIRYPFVQDLGQEEAQRVVWSKEGAGLKALPSGLSPFTSQSGRFVSRLGGQGGTDELAARRCDGLGRTPCSKAWRRNEPCLARASCMN